jgi:hypothetical protein
MQTDDDFLDYVVVEVCPLCENYHEYYLKVTRKPIPGIALPPEYDDESIRFSWETTFHCPVKDEDYKLIVDVEHRIYERVDDVESKLRED